MRVVVSGGGGFIGSHLVDELSRRGTTIQAWTRNTAFSDWKGKVDIKAVDITDRDAISRNLTDFAPDLIVHLAALSLPGRSWAEPALTYQTNVIGTIHLLEVVRQMAAKPRVLIAGSSAEYADPDDGHAIAESAPTGPSSPYGASKLAATHMAQLYVRRYDLDLVCFRPFFLAGPRKTGDVCSDFARRVVAIEHGRASAMQVGSLDVTRDIIDIRDGVQAILRIAQVGRSGEIYNIASGRGVRIGDVLDVFRKLARAPLSVIADPALVRSLEARVRIGDASKLRALGWEPVHDLASTLASILEYWRSAELNP